MSVDDLLLTAQGITIEYGSDPAVRAVDDVSIAIGAGQMLGIVGESGSGKSTLLRSLIGLNPVEARLVAGTVSLRDGTDVLAARRGAIRAIRGARLGYVGQSPFGSLNPVMRIDKQFDNILRAHGRGNKVERAARALASLADMGIPDPARAMLSYPHQLSGGMAQRVVLAIVLSLEPEVLLADEPTTALDVTVQRQIMDLLKLVTADHRRGVVLVTHDLGVVAQYCTDVAIMLRGEIVETGTVHEVFKNPTHPYTRRLLGSVPDRRRRRPADIPSGQASTNGAR